MVELRQHARLQKNNAARSADSKRGTDRSSKTREIETETIIINTAQKVGEH
jgi:hypothetical protein